MRKLQGSDVLGEGRRKASQTAGSQGSEARRHAWEQCRSMEWALVCACSGSFHRSSCPPPKRLLSTPTSAHRALALPPPAAMLCRAAGAAWPGGSRRAAASGAGELGRPWHGRGQGRGQERRRRAENPNTRITSQVRIPSDPEIFVNLGFFTYMQTFVGSDIFGMQISLPDLVDTPRVHKTSFAKAIIVCRHRALLQQSANARQTSGWCVIKR